jgi:hypothetical protein
MGAQIRSLGGDFGAVTVNDNAAKNQNTKATTDYGAADANSMSMAKPKVYVMVSVDPITGKSVEKVVSEEYFEKHFGQLGK